jgi:aspartate racemase
VDSCADHILKEFGRTTVAIFATTGTLKSRIYHDALNSKFPEIHCVSLLDYQRGSEFQDSVMEAIYGSNSGPGLKYLGLNPTCNQTEFSRCCKAIKTASKYLINESNADVLLLACTELPFAFQMEIQMKEKFFNAMVLDSVSVLANAAIRRAYWLE